MDRTIIHKFDKNICKLSILEIATDTSGYLTNYRDWSEALAVEIAQLEGITLGEAHWQVIHFIRAFYLKFNTSPAIRMLVKAMAQKYGKEKSHSRYLFRLFPQGPAKQAAKIAGLPKPVKCL
ncbi:MAG: sulfur transfer protein TusE [Sodalis sp. Fse]|nr:MAG: sulfur transfer protein TusE [Sodalis sp. Fse]